MNQFINFRAFLLALSMLSIFSCTKNELTEVIQKQSSKEIISFDNEKDYSATLTQILAMNLEELKEYEDNKGYKSFGRECDEIYQYAAQQDFQSLEEIQRLVSSHSECLEIVEDEQGELMLSTVHGSNPNRYLVKKTEQKIFIISKLAYKIIEEGVIACNKDSIENLYEVNSLNLNGYLNGENGIRFMPTNIKVSKNIEKDALYNCGSSAENTQTNGTNRTRLTIALSYWDTYDYPNGNVPMTVFKNSVLVKPQKKSLVWIDATRTISCDIKVAVDKETTSG